MDKLLQVVGLDGKYKEKEEPPLSEEELLTLYRYMMLTRALDTRGMALQRQGRIGFYVPSHGEEAVQIGSAFPLEPQDWIVPAYREQGAALLRGLSLEKIVAQLYGNEEDILKGRQMPNHFGSRAINFLTPSSPVGTQIPIATGLGWAARMRGDKTVALAYLGDGATSQGDFHVAMNFAGVYQANTVFVCKNNQWAISVPFASQTGTPEIAIKAQAYGFDGLRVDGNDVLAMYRATKDALDKARAGEGPTLIEAVTYRMGPHTTSDDPTRYRDEAEVEKWRKRDPIVRFQRYLRAKGIWNEEMEVEVRQDAEAQVDKAVVRAEEHAPPPPESLFDDVYAEMPWHLKEAKEAFLKFLEKS
ncbi:MAG: pyruvate dehydrogenase (acetyl-transferring) E1 component subunit alpha [Thermoplasmata archaeon]